MRLYRFRLKDFDNTFVSFLEWARIGCMPVRFSKEDGCHVFDVYERH